jgi:hypothetical protein
MPVLPINTALTFHDPSNTSISYCIMLSLSNLIQSFPRIFSTIPFYRVGLIAPCSTVLLFLGLQPARNQQLQNRQSFKTTPPPPPTFHYKVKIGKINCSDSDNVADLQHSRTMRHAPRTRGTTLSAGLFQFRWLSFCTHRNVVSWLNSRVENDTGGKPSWFI